MAAAKGTPLAIRGGGTRAGLGRPGSADVTLSTSKLTGIVFHAPAEMVIAARAGTPLAHVEAALAQGGQALAFEPMDHRALYGGKGRPTIGAVASANISGPRRIHAGAARDSLIGIRMINGRGEAIKSGGRVMKNVTGLDLVKLVCGAHGTLGLLTEVVFKVLPKAEHTATLVVRDLSDADAGAALSGALGSPFEPTGAAHLPPGIGAARARTLVRIEGFADAVTYRLQALRSLIATRRDTEIVTGPEGDALWASVRDAAFLAEPREAAVWRISTAPSQGPALAAAIGGRLTGARWFYDWGGGLIWLAAPSAGDAGAAVVRGVLAGVGGHATLVRAPDETRIAVPVFEPLAEPLMRLTAGIKAAFDPAGIFEPGRMYA